MDNRLEFNITTKNTKEKNDEFHHRDAEDDEENIEHDDSLLRRSAYCAEAASAAKAGSFGYEGLTTNTAGRKRTGMGETRAFVVPVVSLW